MTSLKKPIHYEEANKLTETFVILFFFNLKPTTLQYPDLITYGHITGKIVVNNIVEID